MDDREIIVSSVEYYGFLKNVPADRVFMAFERTEIMDMIISSHHQFPEMDLGFYIGMVDGVIALQKDAEAEDYRHFEERTAVVNEVAAMLKKRHHLDDLEACRMYYHSKAAQKVSVDSTGYYLKSAKEIFDLIESE